MTVASYDDFSAGMIRDPQMGLLPKNAVWDAVDCLFDVPSKIRARNVTVKPVGATSQTASVLMIGVGGGAGRNGYTYGVKKDGTLMFLGGAGVATALSSAFGTPSIVGRSTSFFGVALFPTYSTGSQSYVPAVYRADDSGLNTYSPPAATVATVTANSSLVTFTGGNFLTGTQANGGQFIVITDSNTSATRNIYLGTFSATGTTSIVVDPIPTKTFTATQGTGTGAFVASVVAAFTQAANPNTNYSYGARCAVIHQNRVLLFGVGRYNGATSQLEAFPRSCFYTILPDAKAEQPSQNVNAQGHAWMFREAIELNNRFDIGGSDDILAAASINDNELVMFTSSQAWRLTGYLATRISNDAGGVTFDVHPIPGSPGLLSERSVQQTPHGLVFAGKFDLYLYAGTRFEPLLGRANTLYWQSLMTNRTVLGSHLLNDDTYVISVGTDGFVNDAGGGDTQTLCYHLPTRTLGRLSGSSLVLFHSVPDPQNQRGHVGVRWWDASLTAPSMTGSQVVYTSWVAGPATGGTADSDGHGVTQQVTTRIYDDGAPDQSKRYWRSVWRTDGAPIIQIQTLEGLYAATSPKSVGTVPARGFSSFTGPVVHSRGVQYILTSQNATSPFELHGFDHYFDELSYAKAS